MKGPVLLLCAALASIAAGIDAVSMAGACLQAQSVGRLRGGMPKAFTRAPSVVTWMAARMPKAVEDSAGDESFRSKPSVVTWNADRKETPPRAKGGGENMVAKVVKLPFRMVGGVLGLGVKAFKTIIGIPIKIVTMPFKK